jgi:hypothetical protein
MEKRHKNTRARTLGCGTACSKLALVALLFVPALLAFKHLANDTKIVRTTEILKIVQITEKPRPRELVKIYSIVKKHRPDIAEFEAWRVAEVILEESLKRDLDPILVLAVIEVESQFQYATVSPMGARGIMQIMPDTGKFLSETRGHEIGLRPAAFRPESLDDPLLNIRLGVFYLHDLKKQFQNLNHALIAYNAGPSEIQNRIDNNLEFSDEYANLVLDKYQRYKKTKQPTF